MTPILICGFNRPETLERVLQVVREVRPDRLYLALDYPRANRPSDVDGWSACKSLFEKIDWPCDVRRNFASSNMGCRGRITSAISWVFETEDSAIILEDDCVPHHSFFRFCEELLERYKNDSRVGMIAAQREFFPQRAIDFHGDSYYFDRMACIGAGWATWRRAWSLLDMELKCLPRLLESNVMLNIFRKQKYVKAWEATAKKIYTRQQKTWASTWATTLYRENMLSIHPVVSPSVNLGFCRSSRTDASRLEFKTPLSTVETAEEIMFPLQHPVAMIPNCECERYFLEDVLARSPIRKILAEPHVAFCRLLDIFKRKLG